MSVLLVVTLVLVLLDSSLDVYPSMGESNTSSS